LVKRRDQLLHARPLTAPNGKQQLFYTEGFHPEAQWPIEDVEQAAIHFENAAITFNALFHEFWPNPKYKATANANGFVDLDSYRRTQTASSVTTVDSVR
jgi:hypothetical protein